MESPRTREWEQALLDAWNDGLQDRSGAPASYIPELAAVDRDLFALAVCDLEGEIRGVGDDRRPFTLQSISKPFVYAWALERLGEAVVHERVGVEPTGEAFDSLVRLDRDRQRPHNPLVNTGALAVTGLLVESGVGLRELLAFLGGCAGRAPLEVDVPVWLSERAGAHRNRAIAHLLRHFGILRAPVEETLELYFRQCAALVTTRELAVMGATLAGYGRDPIRGERRIAPAAAERALIVCSTCGLYDASGRFLFEAGLPAKSGVSGGMLAAAPGRAGLAAFAPPLDADGNSARARRATIALSERVGLHAFARREAIAPPGEGELRAAVETALERARAVQGGAVASYAPLLAAAPADALAVAICSVDGRELTAGDVHHRFSMQAIGNAFAYARVREALGRERLHELVGREPSGNAFHAIELDRRTNRPHNPLGTAGAITVAGAAPGEDEARRLQAALRFLAAAAGGVLAVDAALLEEEIRAGDRNRAIAALLRGAGAIQDEERALQLYFQQCCVVVDVVRLARLGALLANGGRVAGSGVELLSQSAVCDTLSLMYACGQHDGSGRFAFEVGLPAKSGISGAIVAAVPGRFGLAVWSPPVDSVGTSVRGRAFLRELSRELRLGTFADPRRPRRTDSD